ncbi:acetolactate synthase I/II/III large subunit [Capronia epimyces CBS 606.96]|uniref:acetolactate synthase n=1 Tax=Capronia epimyces CBS 606.96 TaxID=1182542 RepID=W9XIA0_9EURO|nr:acetolactate synthase I/II/III large subunit [Capronia epimyces CBS 606.96]EXJ79923.1 acetolactate synthase I/II/III large subunit [Capronia epimyces CBS 606.96]
MHTVLARHEQGAGHMAEGYARATGEPGVVFVVSGAGLTNMVTPLQDALCDGTPMVVFCTQASQPQPQAQASQTPSPSPQIPRFDPREDIDVLSISESCTKWNVMVDSIEQLPRRINEAFDIARAGRPGPVLVLIPAHVSQQILHRPAFVGSQLNRRLYAGESSMTSKFKRSDYDAETDRALHRVARLLRMAKKPVLYVGQGMMGREDGPAILAEFADKACIPVTTSLQGLGAFDELDRKALHMLGLHGTGYANMAMQEADLILALGARFDDRVTGNISKFAPQALAAAAERRGGIVHFDIAPKNINKVVMSTETVVGDCSVNLARLTRLVEQQQQQQQHTESGSGSGSDSAFVNDRPDWFRQIESWKRRFPLSAYSKVATQPQAGLIQAQAVISQLSELTQRLSIKDRTIITTGVGQHQMWAAQHYRWRHARTLITSGGLGTMGYGLPAAIGAKRARPDCMVIDIDGDASFNMTIAELATAAQYDIAVKVLLFNNEQMGMVSDLQRLYYQAKFAHNRQKNPDFVKASHALGVAADRCVTLDQVDEKLRWLLDEPGPAVLEVVTDQHSPVWPVVPAGKGLHEFVTYEED